MTVFRRTTSQVSEPRVSRSSADGFTRLTRLVGRVLLWGCVLLLLIRGAISMFNTGDSGGVSATRGVTVTVTQPAHTETAPAGRK